MEKVQHNNKKRDARTAVLVKDTAGIRGVSERSVYRVLNAKQENEEVLETYMMLQEGYRSLVEYVAQVVPFERVYSAKSKIGPAI